jgi:predicted KAP-like P-loop ATPase
MWSDNEADIDLLGFTHLVAATEDILKNKSLLPATIGVFGDWGSGKSTLLRLLAEKLKDDPNVLVVNFNGWQFEGYEDAKTALIGTILDELRSKRGAIEKAKGVIGKLVRKLNWFRLAATASKYGMAYAAGGLPALGLSAATDAPATLSEVSKKVAETDVKDLEELLKESPADELRHSVRDFRKDFEELLEKTSVELLVVVIDDLDRCLPDTIIETLEAIKLFLFTPRTAFILGADDRLVRYAVRKRFPELPGERVEVGRDYLEKLIQFQIRIPPLSRPEIETYISLLFAKKSAVAPEHFKALCDAVFNGEGVDLLTPSVDSASVSKLLTAEVAATLEENLSLAQRLAPFLASTNGNPRQCKRFLNLLLMRIGMGRTRKIDLKQRLLAKLMLLELIRPESFRKLAELQAQQGGHAKELAEAERLIAQQDNTASPPTTSGGKKTAADKLEPAESSMLPNWLRCDPPLGKEDLRHYFYFSRDKLGQFHALAQRMSLAAQDLLVQLANPSEAVRKLAQTSLKDVSLADATALFEAFAAKAREEEDHGADNSSCMCLFAIASARKDLASQFLTFLETFPDGAIPPKAVPLLLQLPFASERSETIQAILTKWSKSPSKGLKTAAQGRLTSAKQ